MRRINIYIAEPQHQRLQQLAAERGLAYSELIREALTQYLRRQAREARVEAERPQGSHPRRRP